MRSKKILSLSFIPDSAFIRLRPISSTGFQSALGDGANQTESEIIAVEANDLDDPFPITERMFMELVESGKGLPDPVNDDDDDL